METYSNLADKRKFFAQSVVINTPQRFDEEFLKLVELSKNTKIHVVFRGVPEAKYMLYLSFASDFSLSGGNRELVKGQFHSSDLFVV